MDPLALVITEAGLDALVDAQNADTDPILITQIGLSAAGFDAAPTLTGVPGEFKRLDSVAGESVAENIIHMTAQDVSDEVYDLRGFGLYLSDGTLFATYAQDDPIFRKVSIAAFLLAFDVAFSGDVATDVAFGNASFLYPPATETVRGVAEIATQAETDAGVDEERIITPAALKGTLAQRTVSAAGLATGGGSLDQDRTITVAEASAADMAAGISGAKVVTPRRAAVLLPAGAVFAFAMNAAPAGYLECDGAAGSRAAYPALFAAIGTQFGAGDGNTTFNLPDLRGEFIRGWDDGAGIDNGRAFGSAQGDAFASHSHTVQSGTGGGNQLESGQGGATVTTSTSATGGTETRPRNIALLYAIKT